MNSSSELRIGTLNYTMPQMLLVMAFITLAGQAMALLAYYMLPAIMPVLLDQTGCSNRTIAIITGTIPQFINFFICPIISTWSDKCRTRMGRRQPFLLWSTPLVAGLVVLIGWSNHLGGPLASLLHLKAATAILLLLALSHTLYTVCFLVPGSVYYYLYADVLPPQHVGTFLSVFTFIGTGVNFLFNKYMLSYSVNNPGPACTLIALLYAATFLFLVKNVQEGEYPPPPKQIAESFPRRMSNQVTTYFRECYSTRLFTFLFICTAMNQVSNFCRQSFNLLFATKELGVTSQQYGDIMAIGSLAAAIAVLIMGKIMDLLHPIWVYLVSEVIIIAMNVWGYFVVKDEPSFRIVGIAICIIYAIQALAQTPMFIQLFPKEKYGQFCSANSMINCFLMVILTALGGIAIDHFGYRFLFLWDFGFTLLATLALCVVIHDWLARGGKHHYTPPTFG
ncbi:MAG: MFS transporter [Victivallales bacterium]|nr:MFS transporter [Victivallales bacterium]